MSTTIRISRKTKKLLEEIGKKGQTFDELVYLGAIALSNDNNHYSYNAPMFNGETWQESYIEVRVPKSIKKLAVDEEELLSALRFIMEDHDIEEIDDPRDGVVF